MRFIIDECTGPAVARQLREQGHDVFSVYEQARGIDDDEVINRTHAEERILVTNDKDFGEKVYRDGKLHSGIVLLRLRDQSVAAKVAAITGLLEFHSHRIQGAFVVVTDTQVRFARLLET
ncbi:MAG: DUF5615 family PIN-like protein [Armatimonadetes bacterium]|nr:DUF5615 family PIN-like protein [Armatimonadota bacterium]